MPICSSSKSASRSSRTARSALGTVLNTPTITVLLAISSACMACPFLDEAGHARTHRVRGAASCTVLEACCPRHFRTAGAAEDGVPGLHAVSNDAAATVGAGRRQGMDGAFEGIEGMLIAVHGDGECLVVLVAANVTFHRAFLQKKGHAKGP